MIVKKIKKCKFCNRYLRPIKIKTHCNNMHKKCYLIFKRYIDYLDFAKIVSKNQNDSTLVENNAK